VNWVKARIAWIALGSLMLAEAALAATPPPESVALVTEIAGAGTVTQKPDGGPLEQLHELRPGAVVVLQAGTRAVIVHTPTGAVFDLTGPGRFRIQPNGIDALDGARLARRELPAAIKSFQLKPLSTMQASIVMRGAAPARLDGPNGGVVTEEELNFRVRGGVAVTTVELSELEGGRREPIRDAGVSFNVARIAAVQPGKRYALVLKGTDAQGKPIELAARFWIVNGDTAARLQAARPAQDAALTDLIVYAMALESAGATASARSAWQQINERR
jgi:hypothetical protein